jgi:alanine racemase
MTPEVLRPGRLTIDLGALVGNWRALDRRAAPGQCAAVVKANAYGTGIEKAGPALWAAGARTFCVAQLAEGITARRVLPEAAAIYILNGLEPDADPADYAAHGLKPAIGSEGELERWAAFAAARGHALPCALHIDTGMRRLGFNALPDLEAAVARHGICGADLLMSHFVSAEAPNDPINARQIALFEAARAAFRHLPASLANSSGLFLAGPPSYDLARPGYALYGGNPTPGAPNPMRTVATLTIPVQQIRSIEPGATCGYNGQWTAKRPTRLATLLVGYADGLPPGAGATDKKPGADVVIAGRRCPLVGRVSMDLTIADVTDLPEDAVQPGTRAEFFGDAMQLDDFATRSGVIGYQLLTGLGPRYRRDYLAPSG